MHQPGSTAAPARVLAPRCLLLAARLAGAALGACAAAPDCPQDDIYRVAAKWTGDDLYWLPPDGDGSWVVHARFRDGHYERQQTRDIAGLGDIVWRFEPVPLEVVPQRYRRFLRARGRSSSTTRQSAPTRRRRARRCRPSGSRLSMRPPRPPRPSSSRR